MKLYPVNSNSNIAVLFSFYVEENVVKHMCIFSKNAFRKMGGHKGLCNPPTLPPCHQLFDDTFKNSNDPPVIKYLMIELSN